jgi:hypothetical protein
MKRRSWCLLSASLLLGGCASRHGAYLSNLKVPDSYIKALAKEEKVSEDTIRERLAKQREAAAADPATPGRVAGVRGATPPTYPAAKRTAR